jgi:drug/metabolite transporter (DMT)-like permease
VTRAMSAWMHPVAMQFHTSWAGVAICLPVLLALEGSGIAALDSIWPQGWMWLWLFGVGFWACVSHLCMTYALAYAPSSTIVPLHYFEIVVAVALGWAIFGDLPNAMSLGGIVVIVASGLYVIHRERVAAQARPARRQGAAGAG